MSPAEFEPTIPASDRPQTHALDRSATVSFPYGYIYFILANHMEVNFFDKLLSIKFIKVSAFLNSQVS
jgi:hypothetical protein